MMRHYDHTSIRIWMECKMYEKMTDEEDDVCAICLGELGDQDVVCTLNEKFACQCKNRIHEVCLSEWVMTRLRDRNDVGCIVCRQPVGVWNVQQRPNVPCGSMVVNVGHSTRDERLRAFLAGQVERQENMIAARMRLAGIFCVCVVLALLLLSLAGIIS